MSATLFKRNNTYKTVYPILELFNEEHIKMLLECDEIEIKHAGPGMLYILSRREYVNEIMASTATYCGNILYIKEKLVEPKVLQSYKISHLS